LIQVFEGLYAFPWREPTVNNCNAYLIDADKKVLIDPGHYRLFGQVRDPMAKLALDVSDIDMVIITHAHPDHMEAVKVFLESSAVIGLSQAEMAFINQTGPLYEETLGVPKFEPHVLLREGTLKVGRCELRVLQTPGHSPGSISLYWPEKKALFSGDVVFDGGIGRTDLPGGNTEALSDSLNKISQLDLEYLLPGHGELLSGRERIDANMAEIKETWFSLL